MPINDGLPFRTASSVALGISARTLRDLVRGGALRRVFHGVLVDADVPDSRQLRVGALRLVTPPDAVISDHSAAWAYGVSTFPPGKMREMRPHCLVRHGHARPRSGRALVRQTTLPDPDLVEIDGVPVTSPVRTCVDLLRMEWRPYALAAADAMVRAGVVDQHLVAESVAHLRRLPGTKQAQELAPRIDPDAESHGESWMRCRMLDAGLPRPTLQIEQRVDGRVYRLDAGYLEQRIGSEYDGREFHEGQAAEIHDGDRRLLLGRRLSWNITVATRESIFGEDASFEQELGRLLNVPVRPRQW